MERPEDRRIGGPLGGLLVDHLDQHRQTERVGQQDELLALVVALVADGGEEFDPGEPLLAGQPDLLGEREQVLDRGTGDLTGAVVGGMAVRLEHLGEMIGRREMAHRDSPCVSDDVRYRELYGHRTSVRMSDEILATRSACLSRHRGVVGPGIGIDAEDVA